MGDPCQVASPALQTLWFRLVGQGVRMGLTLHDAEDVAQDSVVAALDAYEPSRGDFGGLAYTAYRNRARNVLSRTRTMVPVEDVEPHDWRPGPLGDLLRARGSEAVERIAAVLQGSLGEEEGRFFLELGRVLEEQGDRAVSEASRRVGLSPRAGWDLFRKIQRKARKMRLPWSEEMLEYLEEMDLPAAPAMGSARCMLEEREAFASHSLEYSSEPSPPDEFPSLRSAPAPGTAVVAAEVLVRPWEGYRRFLERVGDAARERLSAILG